MKNNKQIRILFKIPEDWVDYEDPVFGLGSLLHSRLEPMLKEAVVEKAVSQMKMPEIKITPEEVKDRMLTILAERALEKDD